jgi:hypothetical protein
MPLPKPVYFLEAYSNAIFIETGSHQGDGIQQALDAGFECIYSVELSPTDFGFCTHRFRNRRDKVHLVNEDSRQFLESLVPTVTTQITFWLDAHECGSGSGSAEDCPLWAELRCIAAHPIKHHTILIDDVRLFGSPSWPSKVQVETLLREINRRYTITYRDSADYGADILCATPPKKL